MKNLENMYLIVRSKEHCNAIISRLIELGGSIFYDKKSKDVELIVVFEDCIYMYHKNTPSNRSGNYLFMNLEDLYTDKVLANKYRILQVGDVIQKGDEIKTIIGFVEDTQFTGYAITEVTTNEFRRKL